MATRYKRLLDSLINGPSSETPQSLLGSMQFDDEASAFAGLQRLVGNPRNKGFAKLLPVLLSTLPDVASPDRALTNLEHFVDAVQNRSALFKQLAKEPRTLEALLILFAGSQFLSEILLRRPQYFDLIMNRQGLSVAKTLQQFLVEADESISDGGDFETKLDALRRFQQRELFRIGSADLLSLLELTTVSTQLTHLAVCQVRSCLSLVMNEMRSPVEGWAVLALGKLGGRELNYSSDIDLLFLARENSPDGQKLGQRLIEALTKVTSEGFLYRVDMRLRPWGQVGTLVPGIEEHLSYLQKSAQIWEKQALYKARYIAGDEVLAIEFIQTSKDFIASLNAKELREEIRSMKEKIEDQLRKRGKHFGEVKAGEGSIRDVEFVTQYLQLTNGHTRPEVHSRNTLDGLARLRVCGVLSAHEYRTLSEGYVFLRSAEHHLQIMHYRQTHSLPEDARELAYLARRLGFHGRDVGGQLYKRYRQHSAAIREIYRHYFLSPTKNDTIPVARATKLARPPIKARRHLARLDTSYAQAFTVEEITEHIEMADQLSHDHPAKVLARRLGDSDWRVTVVAFDYVGELSLICGLLFEYAMNILEGHIFTYEPSVTRRFNDSSARPVSLPTKAADTRRKIVDVFTVRALDPEISDEVWDQYASDLNGFVRQLREKQQREVHGALATRIAQTLSRYPRSNEALLPVDISIDNYSSKSYTVLRIDAPDTIGFLFELTNALALNGIYISRVTVSSLGHRVHDTLFVTDAQGNKIVDAEKQHQLRTATVLVQHFTHLLPQSPNPQSAMLHFGEFVENLFSQPQWTGELASLNRPDVLGALAKLLGVSDFLWSDFLRMQHANLFPIFRNLSGLRKEKSKAALQEELIEVLARKGKAADKRDELNAFKDREMFRIDIRYINGLVPRFDIFSRELSNLAEVVIEAAFRMCLNELTLKFGKPKLDSGRRCRFAVCGLGKFGGKEVGVASDIELLFLYEGEGNTSGGEMITNAEFFEELVTRVRKMIRAKHDGIFELDLRLRPYGRAGNLAVALRAFKDYYSPFGPAWDYERQALVKLRPLLGHRDFQKVVVATRDSIIYEGFNFSISAVRAMRERQVRQLVEGGTINAKFSPGGLVDLEYLVQGLQLRYGSRLPELRAANTTNALTALQTDGRLYAEDAKSIREAHLFLRKLIEALRLVRGNAKDLTVPPPDTADFDFLARRLDYSDVHKLQSDLLHHTSNVLEVSKRLLS